MSEPAPERSSGGGLARKIGPLPLWGWAAIIGVLVLIYAYYKKSQAANASSANSSAAAGQAAGGVDSSLVPQFINQSYVNATPPTAPNVTVNNTLPPNDVTVPVTVNNPTPAPPTTTPPVAKPPTPRPVAPFEPIFNSTYVVKKGQTLQQVATQFGLTREQLAHANGLGTGAGLRTGQVLKVPKPAPGGTPNKAQ
jgi:LysM repeat protein